MSKPPVYSPTQCSGSTPGSGRNCTPTCVSVRVISCVNKSHSVSPGCMFAVVLALEEDAVIHNFVAEPGSDALKVDRSPDTLMSHILGGEEVRDRRKGLLNDFRWKGSIRTIVNGGLASNRLCLLLLKARSTYAVSSRQVILTFRARVAACINSKCAPGGLAPCAVVQRLAALFVCLLKIQNSCCCHFGSESCSLDKVRAICIDD